MKNGYAKTLSLGIQHVLAMYAGAVVVPLIVGAALGLNAEQLTYLVSIDIFMCGAATACFKYGGINFSASACLLCSAVRSPR